MVSATQPGLVSPSISTVTRIQACTPPSIASARSNWPTPRMRAPARTGAGKADLVAAVIDAEPRAVDAYDLRQKEIDQR